MKYLIPLGFALALAFANSIDCMPSARPSRATKSKSKAPAKAPASNPAANGGTNALGDILAKLGQNSNSSKLSPIATIAKDAMKAMENSKSGKMDIGQVVGFSSKMLSLVGNMTETSKANIVKIKAYVMNGMKTMTRPDQSSVTKLVLDSFKMLGNGTKNGENGVIDYFKGLLGGVSGSAKQDSQSTDGLMGIVNSISSLLPSGGKGTAGSGNLLDGLASQMGGSLAQGSNVIQSLGAELTGVGGAGLLKQLGSAFPKGQNFDLGNLFGG